MNRLVRKASSLRIFRYLWVIVFSVLICAAVLLVVVFGVRQTERINMPYRVHIYGICPDCGIAIETTLELYLESFWDGMGSSRIASSGRVLSGRTCVFDCPSCDAQLRAYVDFCGKRTRAAPYGEYTRVWDINRKEER
jgi:hypothetical protein